MSETRVGDQGAAWLARLPRLTQLRLSGTKITDQAMKDWPTNTNMDELDLGGTRIGDATLQAVAQRFPNLWQLNVESTSVTANGLSILAGRHVRILGAPRQ